jgi:hypothetical protein
MERGVERPLSDLESVARDPLNMTADSPAMHGLQGKCLQYQQIQRPLNDIGSFWQFQPSPVEAKGEYRGLLSLRKRIPAPTLAHAS